MKLLLLCSCLVYVTHQFNVGAVRNLGGLIVLALPICTDDLWVNISFT